MPTIGGNGFRWYQAKSGSTAISTWNWGSPPYVVVPGAQYSYLPASPTAEGYFTGFWRGKQDPTTGNDRQAILVLGFVPDGFGGTLDYADRRFMGILNSYQTFAIPWLYSNPDPFSLAVPRAMRVAAITTFHVVDYDTIIGPKPYFGVGVPEGGPDQFRGTGYNFKATDEQTYQAVICTKSEDGKKWSMKVQSYANSSIYDTFDPIKGTKSFTKSIPTTVFDDTMITPEGIFGDVISRGNFSGPAAAILTDFCARSS